MKLEDYRKFVKLNLFSLLNLIYGRETVNLDVVFGKSFLLIIYKPNQLEMQNVN